MIHIISLITAALIAVFMLYAAIVSFQEKEPRACGSFLVLSLAGAALFALAPLITYHGNNIISLIPNAGFYGMLLLFFFPRKQTEAESITPNGQIDERITMFSRSMLKPGTIRYQEYYNAHPEHKRPDDTFRKLPGLLNEKAAFYEPKAFLTAEAHFNIIKKLRPHTDGKIAGTQVACDKQEISHYLKDLARLNGAHSAGITKLRQWHLYSYRGREHNYGEKVNNTHTYAIALTVPMNRDMVRNAPYAATVSESARQYVNSGIIAIELAQLIRDMGYPARAHIDGEYEVVCPLVARDAGLGEIGRMGLLMTPNLGPRVRIAVVTTSLPLQPDIPKANTPVLEFCRICKKCAEACPARAIPFGDRTQINGVLRWQINQEACFTYWCRAGTDCARCMSVCPYSHPDNALHRVVRYGINNSALFRPFALKMDHLFYGRKPKPLPNPLNGKNKGKPQMF